MLYLNGQGFYCRLFAKVAYQSQSEDAAGRAMLRLRKIEARLGDDGEKPPRMHWRTYERLVEQANEADLEAMLPLMRRFLPYLPQ